MKLSPPTRRWTRRSLAVGLTLVALNLGGCIYLRLLELKNQLADFDHNFTLDLRDGIKLTCLHPVLLDEDMAFFQLAPEKKERVGVAERWHFRWVKDYAVPGEDPTAFEVMAEFIFVGHKLTRVILPERLFTFIPKGAFISLLRAVGQAKIDEAKRSATADYREKQTDRTADPVIPAMAQISGALGVPKEITGTDQAVLWRYRYRRASPNQRSGQIDMTFGFNPTTRKIQRLRGRLFDLTMDFSFTSSAAAPAATPAP